MVAGALRRPGAGTNDCFLADLDAGGASRLARAPNVPLLNGAGRELRLYPYPKTGAAPGPPEAIGLPARPRTGHEPQDAAEEEAAAALTRMHEVLARVGDVSIPRQSRGL
jgi:hypothetical protein